MVARSQPTRARSPQAKRVREAAILDAAARLATADGIRAVTLTDIATAVGMHKSAMLRYFETREEIFLRLAGAGWAEWSREVRRRLAHAVPGAAGEDPAVETAALLAESLVARPLFCDLLAHTPMNLERNVSTKAVRSFKLTAVAEAGAVGAALRRVVPLSPPQAGDVVATATAMAGALWQMAAPGTELRRFYESDPALAHAVVDVAPRLTGILTALLRGYGATRMVSRPPRQKRPDEVETAE
ncbi:TetR/AcrR family transcriptional regulator [Streptomyces hainanensis]|uniref:TetR/AcrR family transcriptional regulator n=1 Tax=Streptomyces hainanensis TaxID=402648 RepID=A0A4R4TKL9_9ACTN|nr:TetR family transcriptional regulator [Streptomyces hainanensis]TDC74639.1 TetR/AcrR family transcriptional regulator [Streptomyces hainanensis]